MINSNIRLSPICEALLSEAEKTAITLRHDNMCTEHLIMAILKIQDARLDSFKKIIGVDYSMALQAMDRAFGTDSTAKELANLEHSPRLKKFIKIANQEALHMNHQCVTLDHFVLAFIKCGVGGGYSLLKEIIKHKDFYNNK